MMKGYIHNIFRGVFLTVCLSGAAYMVADTVHIPAMVIALICGIALSFIGSKPSVKPGVTWASVYILQTGIVLLGFGISFEEIATLGLETLCLIALSICMVISFGVLASKLGIIGKNIGLLTGGATAICGASAAMALSSVLPNSKAKENDLLLTIIATTTFSSIVMILYPYICHYFDLSNFDAGVFLGASIHNVPQAVGAGYIVSPEAGEIATLTKLIRVSFLLPVMFFFLLLSKKNAAHGKKHLKLPLFLILFFIAIVLNNTITLPDSYIENAVKIGKFLLLVAITAIGLKSDPRYLLKSSLPVLLIVMVETVLLAGIVLTALLYI
jgi:uncharacterized integral membrane protein (TIGR00698 family)